MAAELYLASTPLHILNAVAIASTRSADAWLLLIDQQEVESNHYFRILSDMPDSPFAGQHIFPGRIKGHRAKLKSRRETFARIDDIVAQLAPEVIYTGNDRRIEFQYAMHSCQCQHGSIPRGVYMDEGTFTYVGRKDSTSFSDQYVDNLLKKLTYGLWWKNPVTIGGSAWISDVYAAFPELVHPLLQTKTLHPLQPLYNSNATVKSFCRQLASYFSAPANGIAELDCVLTLPHESIIERIPGYKEAMFSVVGQLQSAGLNTGVKYHPRNQNPDILNAESLPGFSLLPHRIPFEALLPLLRDDVIIVGDVSSTLINSRWLKPTAHLLSVANPEVPLYEEFCALFHKLDVEVTDSSHITNALQRTLS